MRRYHALPYEGFMLVFDLRHGGVVAAFEGTDPETYERAERAAGKLGLMQAATRSKVYEKHGQELRAFPGIILDGLEAWRGLRPKDVMA